VRCNNRGAGLLKLDFVASSELQTDATHKARGVESCVFNHFRVGFTLKQTFSVCIFPR
jgi:hypothetical protein